MHRAFEKRTGFKSTTGELDTMNKLLGVFLLAGLSTTTLAGCYHHTYTVGLGGNTSSEAAYSHWHSHWFYGIFGDKDVHVKEVCPSGNATIKDETSFLNGLVSEITGFIWSSTTVEIYCDTGGAVASMSLTLTPEEARRLARSPELRSRLSHENPDLSQRLEAAIAADDRHERRAAAASTPTTF
jgi:hypothetical protein